MDDIRVLIFPKLVEEVSNAGEQYDQRSNSLLSVDNIESLVTDFMKNHGS